MKSLNDWNAPFNVTHLWHIKWTLIVQGVLGVTTGNWYLGAMAGSAYFFGREVKETESKVLKHHGFKTVKQAIDSGFNIDRERFKPKYWSIDGLNDWLLPAIVSFALAVIVEVWG